LKKTVGKRSDLIALSHPDILGMSFQKENTMAKILNVTTLSPKYKYSTAEVVSHADQMWLSKVDHTIRRAALKIFEGAQINTRYAAVPITTVFADLSFKEKNDLYIEAAIDMGCRVLEKALKDSGTRPDELDYLITTSCTGFMIPSVDAYIVNKLGLRQDIKRLPVTEMGCAGGTSALIYAHDILRSNPGTKLAIVSVEIPSITFQKEDLSMENLVSTAIFADGAAAVIMGDSDKVAPEIIDSAMYHFPNATHLMGYQLHNSGLKIVLDRDVPDSIHEHFPKIFFPFLERNHLKPEDVKNYMFHPGGKKIINRVEDFIGRYGKDISDSKNVLRDHGNMSSATILHILERIMKKDNSASDLGYMLAFGPGFVAQSLLVRWG
jgi:alkylresorcinol/alkylpyrone synthase